MRYAVSIPAPADEAFDLTLIVEATDWMSALRLAIAEGGLDESLEPLAEHSLLCDLQTDGSVRVVDGISQRIFHLRPVEDTPGRSPIDTIDERHQSDADVAHVVDRTRKPSGTFASVAPSLFEPSDTLVDVDLVEAVLEELAWVYDATAERSLTEVTERVLELAMRLIPSRAGAVLYANLQATELFFAAARGPAAPQVMRYRVPLGRGFVGFCVREGVTLAVPRAATDKRLYRPIADALGPPTTVACAPVKTSGRVFGAIELLDKQSDSATFTAADAALLTHIASQLAHWLDLQM